MCLATPHAMTDTQRLSVTEVAEIASEAARMQSSNLRVTGVTLGNGDGDYAEVIIDLAECRTEPCRLSVGIFRSASRETVREEIAEHLRQHVREHGM